MITNIVPIYYEP